MHIKQREQGSQRCRVGIRERCTARHPRPRLDWRTRRLAHQVMADGGGQRGDDLLEFVEVGGGWWHVSAAQAGFGA